MNFHHDVNGTIKGPSGTHDLSTKTFVPSNNCMARDREDMDVWEKLRVPIFLAA